MGFALHSTRNQTYLQSDFSLSVTNSPIYQLTFSYRDSSIFISTVIIFTLQKGVIYVSSTNET